MKKIEVLDFYAQWCGPCKKVSPIIDELMTEYKNNENVVIKKLDVDIENDMCIKYNIKSIPTIIFVENDDVLYKLNNAQISKTEIKTIIEKLL